MLELARGVCGLGLLVRLFESHKSAMASVLRAACLEEVIRELAQCRVLKWRVRCSLFQEILAKGLAKFAFSGSWVQRHDIVQVYELFQPGNPQNAVNRKHRGPIRPDSS